MFHGSMVALVTPMTVTGDIDYKSLETLVDFHLENDTKALIVAGTTGESAALSTEEKQSLFKKIVEQVKRRIPVIAGTGTSNTRTTVELTELAMQCGVDGVIIVTPSYVRPTQDGLIAHYKAVAAAVPLPIIAYNVPSRTACDLFPETIIRLADIPNLVGVKEATGEMWRLQKILDHCGDKVDVYSGDDTTCCDFMLQGGKGVISVTANVAPGEMAAMAKAAISKNEDAARALNESLQVLHSALFIESNPIPVKWALHALGKIDVGIRLPLTALRAEHHDVVRQALKVIQ